MDRDDMAAVWALLLPHRGDAKAILRLFEITPVPMVLFDSTHRILDANPASCLFLRRTRHELRQMRSEDINPPADRQLHDRLWAELLETGSSSARVSLLAPDGQVIGIDYHTELNMLPGAHLTVWLPSDWPAMELGHMLPGEEPLPRRRLSPREREVLTVLARGASLEQISEELSLSPSTVRTHIRNAMRRLGAHHRAHAVALAISSGEISPERSSL